MLDSWPPPSHRELEFSPPWALQGPWREKACALLLRRAPSCRTGSAAALLDSTGRVSEERGGSEAVWGQARG